MWFAFTPSRMMIVHSAISLITATTRIGNLVPSDAAAQWRDVLNGMKVTVGTHLCQFEVEEFKPGFFAGSVQFAPNQAGPCCIGPLRSALRTAL